MTVLDDYSTGSRYVNLTRCYVIFNNEQISAEHSSGEFVILYTTCKRFTEKETKSEQLPTNYWAKLHNFPF